MNRRGFLQRFGIGLAGALALAQLPASAVEALTQPDAARLLACEYLRKRYNEFARGRSVWDQPERIEVSRGLFEAFEGELVATQRFVYNYAPPSERNLCFKAARVVIREDIQRWEDLRIIGAAA